MAPTNSPEEPQYLYPSEFLAFIECEDVPLQWRRMVALGVYTYCRAGELRALTWDDMDLEHGTIAVTKSIEGQTGQLKCTKSRTPRLLPIEPTLVPMLRAMRDEPGGAGSVLAMSPRQHLSESFKRLLKVAGVNRPALFERGPGVAPIRFHDCRSSGVTWDTVRGTLPLVVLQRAGHTSFETTQRYLRTAETIRSGFGEALPALPTSLFRSEEAIRETLKLNSVGGTGFEPATLGL